MKEWGRFLLGKYDYKKFARHDPDEYEKMNKEPNRKAGKTLGNMSVISTYALLIALFLFGAVNILTLIFGLMTILTPVMNWGFGLREELLKKGEKYMRVKAWDMKERVRQYFFPEYDWGPLNFIPDHILYEKMYEAEFALKETLLRTEEITEEAMLKLDDDVIELREKIMKSRDQWEKALREKLNAVPLLRKLRGQIITVKDDDGKEVEKEVNNPKQDWYFYSVYPERKLEKQCIMAFRHEIEKAMDSNLKGKVTGLFRRFWARQNDVEGILAGTVDEILLQGINTDEVKADIPEYIKAIKKETPIIVVILCDADRREAIRGLMPKPPGAALLWLIRVVKALINLDPLLEELDRKDSKIIALEDSKESLLDDQKTGIVDWRMRTGQLYPIPDTEEEIPEYVTERVPLARRQAIIVLLLGMAIGAILCWYLIPFMGFRIIPVAPAAGMLIQRKFSFLNGGGTFE
jgi:hypothetical protein